MGALEDFLGWLRTHADMGQRLMVDDLGPSPTDVFHVRESPDYVRDFYARVDRWTAWRMALVGGMRRRLLEAEHLVAEAEIRFSTDRLLRFRLRHVDGDVLGEVDLRRRDIFLDVSGWIELRTHFLTSRAEPTWEVVRTNINTDLKAFVTSVEAQRANLVLAGEPRSPKLEDAMALLTRLGYVDAGLVKTDLVATEAHFRAGHGKDACGSFRRAVEQILNDAYREAVNRGAIPAPGSTPDTFSQSEAVGKTLATKASARQAYGAYALLSELGSHTGAIAPDELEAAWHSGLAGVFMLARRLKA